MNGSKQDFQHNSKKNLKYIKLCKDRASADSQIEQIPITSIQNELGFEYMPDSLQEAVNTCQKLCGNILAKYSVLKNPEDIFIIHSISHRLGRSLTTTKPIKKNTIILEYVGELIPPLQKKDNIYSIYMGYSPSYISTFTHAKSRIGKIIEGTQYFDIENGIFVSAQNKGNLSRFINHLPDESGVKEVKCANLDVEYLPSSTGHLRAFFITKKDINAFEELGFDYGENFFRVSDEKPVYLNSKTGGIHEISQSTKSSQSNFEASTALQRNESTGINLKFTVVISALILAIMLSYVMRDNSMNGQSR